MKMIQFKSQLLDYLKSMNVQFENFDDIHIAVEALIFTPAGKLILEKRGKMVQDEVGKLEGVGGSIGSQTDLHAALSRLIANEIGEQVNVKIDQLLEIRLINFVNRDRGKIEWVIVSYLCKLISGQPEIFEPDMIEELCKLTLDELFAYPQSELSLSTIAARETYRKQFGNQLFFTPTN